MATTNPPLQVLVFGEVGVKEGTEAVPGKEQVTTMMMDHGLLAFPHTCMCMYRDAFQRPPPIDKSPNH